MCAVVPGGGVRSFRHTSISLMPSASTSRTNAANALWFLPLTPHGAQFGLAGARQAARELWCVDEERTTCSRCSHSVGR